MQMVIKAAESLSPEREMSRLASLAENHVPRPTDRGG